MQSLGRRLFPLFALALDLPRDYFDDKVLSDELIVLPFGN